MEIELTYLGEDVIGFEDDTYRCVGVKRFAWNGLGADREVLAALIEHPDYRDGHVEDPGSQPLHGPYDAEALTADAFELVSRERVTALVEEFFQLHDRPPSATLRAQIDAQGVGPLAAGPCYRLREQPEAVLLGGVFLDFQELVGLDRAHGTVLLVDLAAEL